MIHEEPITSPLVTIILAWLSGQPLIGALLALMTIDVLVGIFAAIARHTLNSSVSWQGMSKKAIMLLLVGLAATLEPLSQGIPLAKLVATFYMVTESISILENAALSGVPLPSALTDVLVKLAQPTKPMPSRRENDLKGGRS